MNPWLWIPIGVVAFLALVGGSLWLLVRFYPQQDFPYGLQNDLSFMNELTDAEQESVGTDWTANDYKRGAKQ